MPLLLLAAGIVWTTRSPALPEALPAPKNPALPDLAMSPLTEISASSVVGGPERLLAFTGAIAASASALFNAVRADERGGWRVSQRYDESDGSLSETMTEGTLVWGGHGHDHWHVELGASYWLTRSGSGERLRRFAKAGYCFFDQRALRERPPSSRPEPGFPRNGCSTPDVCVGESLTAADGCGASLNLD